MALERTQPPPRTRERAPTREIFGWCMFDFANSSYTTVMISVVFNQYFISVVTPERGDFFWGLSIFLSMAMVLVTAPVVGAFADFSASKKRLLAVTWIGCILTTTLLFFARGGDVVFAMVFFVASNFFFSSGENLVAAFLPEIAPEEEMGRISGYGWALGYFGGLGSLLVCLPVIGETETVPWCFPIVAAFFLVGGLPTFLLLRERAVPRPRGSGSGYASIGFRRVARTLRQITRFRQLFRFLIVFLFYNAGVMIVVAFAAPYARTEIGMSYEEVFLFFLIVQLSAAAGAFVFGLIQDRLGAGRTIIITLLMWTSVALVSYFTTSAIVFYIVGNVAGMAMGATQSGSRALVGTFSPVERTAEFFGFWGLSWKLSSGLGPLLFGTVVQASGYRAAILSTAGLFIVGLLGMGWIDEQEGKRTARAAEREAGKSGPE